MTRPDLTATDGDASHWSEHLRGYRAAVGGDRPLGWVMVLGPVGWALWVASAGHPPIGLAVAFAAGGILLRAACCMIDGYFGALQDARAGRIARFPPDADRVDPRLAALLCVVLLVVVASLILALNPLTAWLGASWLLLALGYLLVKRHLYLVQAYIGVLASWGVPLAFAAVTGGVSHAGWTLFVASVLLVTASATWRALAERDEDLLSGAKSIALLLGGVEGVAQGVLYGCAMVALVLFGRSVGLGSWYWLGLLVATLLAGLGLRAGRRCDSAGCLHALNYSGWMVAAVYFGIVLDYALRARVIEA